MNSTRCSIGSAATSLHGLAGWSLRCQQLKCVDVRPLWPSFVRPFGAAEIARDFCRIMLQRLEEHSANKVSIFTLRRTAVSRQGMLRNRATVLLL